MDLTQDYVICPGCGLKMALDAYGPRELNELSTTKTIWWSDGQITNGDDQFMGSLAACPLCWVAFPKSLIRQFVSSAQAFEPSNSHLLVSSSHRMADNSSLPFSSGRKISVPTFKTWRLSSLNIKDDDPILFAQAAESFMYANNDRLRKKVMRAQGLQVCIFDKEPTPQNLELFVARVKNNLISPDSHSQVFDSTLGEFFGVYRLYFMCAEISRSIRKFEWADEFIRRIDERRQTVSDTAEETWESPGDVQSVAPFLWNSDQAELRLRTLKDLRNTGGRHLTTVQIARV